VKKGEKKPNIKTVFFPEKEKINQRGGGGGEKNKKAIASQEKKKKKGTRKGAPLL